VATACGYVSDDNHLRADRCAAQVSRTPCSFTPPQRAIEVDARRFERRAQAYEQRKTKDDCRISSSCGAFMRFI
jgi:hypothetical protein